MPYTSATDLFETQRCPTETKTHDLIALGDIKRALQRRPKGDLTDDEDPERSREIANDHERQRSSDQILRLPLLLRLLTVAQPHSSIPLLKVANTSQDRAGRSIQKSDERGQGDNGTPSRGKSHQNKHEREITQGSKMSPTKMSQVAADKVDIPAILKGDSTSSFELDELVATLEVLATSHPAAEGIEVLCSYLAPHACRKIVKYAPLKREYPYGQSVGGHKSIAWRGEWDVSPLEKLATGFGIIDGGIVRKRKKMRNDVSVNEGGDDVVEDMDEDEDSENPGAKGKSELKSLPMGPQKKKRKKDHRPGLKKSGIISSSSTMAVQDSQESAVSKTLSEITSLVMTALSSSPSFEFGSLTEGSKSGGRVSQPSAPTGDGGPVVGTQSTSAPVALSVKSESLLMESTAGVGPDSLGSGGGSDLSAILPALMHHAPFLRHRHVAYAVCRAALPQTATLVSRMAANCTAASSCLIRGCVDAYLHATASSSKDISSALAQITAVMSSASAAVQAIADLSPREAARVTRMLSSWNILPEISLTLRMKHDPLGAVTMIIDDLLSSEQEQIEPLTGLLDEGKAKDHSSGVKEVQRKGDIKESNQDQDEPSGGTSRKIRWRRIRKHPQQWLEGVQKRKSLAILLDENDSLATETRKFFLEYISSMVANRRNSIPARAEGAIMLRAYGLFMLHIGPGINGSPCSGLNYVKSMMTKMEALVGISCSADICLADGELSGSIRLPTAPSDIIQCVALSACLATCARFPPIGDATDKFVASPATQVCLRCLSTLLTSSNSCKSDVMIAKVASCLISHDGTELSAHILRSLQRVHSIVDRPNRENAEAAPFVNTCRWAVEALSSDKLADLSKRGVSLEAMLADVTCVFYASQRGMLRSVQLDSLIKDVLHDEDKCGILFHISGALALVEEAVKRLVEDCESIVPVVLPLHLESLAKKVDWDLPRSCSDTPGSRRFENLKKQIVLNFLYAVIFLESKPESPFVIEPRLLPIREIVSFCKNSSVSSISSINDFRGTSEMHRYHARIQEILGRKCPDVLARNLHPGEYSVDIWSSIWRSDQSKRITPKIISDAIQTALHSNKDPSGCKAESLFLHGRDYLVHPSADMAAACALLSTKNLPPPVYSYSSLCNDPLVILRCNVFTWQCRGLRRIALLVLDRLLDANVEITLQVAQTKKVAEEILCARDLLVSRCLIIAAGGRAVVDDDVGGTKPVMCSLTVNLVRTLVSRRSGLVTMIIKQGLPEAAVDWLVQFVPECFLDAHNLTACLSGRNALTATERLAAADAALRIAVAHGCRDEARAQPLLYAAMTVLVSSFFLVLGPVGLAVNVLCEEGGEDVTQKCRTSYFRMLNEMQNLSGKADSLKNEAHTALQKISVLCKNESTMSGVGGLAAMRRKVLLKDIWDATNKAINALGGAQM